MKSTDLLQGEDLLSDSLVIRELRADDLDWVTKIDREHSGALRTEYFKLKLREARSDTGVRISLAALLDNAPVGFVMGRLYYGEFGAPERTAILDSLGVARSSAGRGVGRALLRQLKVHLAALRVDHVETQ